MHKNCVVQNVINKKKMIGLSRIKIRHIYALIVVMRWVKMSTKREQQVTGYEVTVVSRLVGNLLSICFYWINREVVTVVTGYYGKLIIDAKSLILLQLTNLPRLTPYRGYRGVVSNPPPPPIFFLASNTINCSELQL